MKNKMKNKTEDKDLENINEAMKGWEIVEVRRGFDEERFIFHLVKNKSKRTVVLGANDLGGWLVR